MQGCESDAVGMRRLKHAGCVAQYQVHRHFAIEPCVGFDALVEQQAPVVHGGFRATMLPPV